MKAFSSLQMPDRVLKVAGFAAFSLLVSYCDEQPLPRSQNAARLLKAPIESVVNQFEAVPAPSPKTNGCSEGMARIEGFCMDKFEAYLISISSGEPNPYSVRPGDIRGFMAVSKPGAYPQGYISQVEAGIACRNAGKRLCSRKEWFASCRGRSDDSFPYGKKLDIAKCNSAKTPYVMMLHFGKRDRDIGWTFAEFNDPGLNSTPGYLSKGGEFGDCRSAEGVYDLVGNLHEWTADREVRNGKTVGIFLSSCYSNVGDGCNWGAVSHSPEYHDYSTGFRCCTEPK